MFSFCVSILVFLKLKKYYSKNVSFFIFVCFFQVFHAQTVFYRVKKIADGDTFWIDNGTTKGEKIRLIGIDAPQKQRALVLK